MSKQLILQQAERGKSATSNQIEELKQLMGCVAPALTQFNRLKDGKNSELLSAYAFDKSLAEALSLGTRSETLSRNMKAEINENTQKIMMQTNIQEDIQAAQREQMKQKDRAMDFSL